MARLAAAFAVGLCLLAVAQAASPPTLQSVGNSYKAAYHYVQCDSEYVIEPDNTADVAQAIKDAKALAAERGLQLKIRASRRLFHSTVSYVCPNQFKSFAAAGARASDATPGVLSVAILQDKMNNTVKYDTEKHTMTVQGGMKLREFADEATRVGMSVQVGSLPAYAGLTLAGVLSTSAHGSGDNATSNICDTLVSLTWVDADGEVHVSPRASPEVKLMCGGLGLIGVITELTLQLTPTTHTKLITRYLANDTDIVNDIAAMLKVSPHILVFWRPDMKTYSAYMLKPVSSSIPATDAYMTLLPNYKGRANMANLFRLIQEDIFDTTFTYQGPQQAVLCPIVAANSMGKTWASNPDGSDVLYAVGKTNALAAGECWDGCAWNSDTYNGTAEDVHMSIEWDRFADWTADIKAIFERDLWATEQDKGRCLGPGYIWLRFGHGTPDYMSMTYDMKRPVYVQSTWLKSRTVMDKYPMRYGFVTDLLEEVTLCKYGGRPHWGKNYIRTFTHPTCTIPKRFPDSFKAALKIQEQFDPKRVFEPQLWKHVREGKAYKLYDGCALDKACYCETDSNCPAMHRCVSSNAPGLEKFKACKPDWRLKPQLGRTVADGSNPHTVLSAGR